MFLSLKSTRPRRRLRPHERPLTLETSRVVFLTLQSHEIKKSLHRILVSCVCKNELLVTVKIFQKIIFTVSEKEGDRLLNNRNTFIRIKYFHHSQCLQQQ